jgi:hypothetical protein
VHRNECTQVKSFPAAYPPYPGQVEARSSLYAGGLMLLLLLPPFWQKEHRLWLGLRLRLGWVVLVVSCPRQHHVHVYPSVQWTAATWLQRRHGGIGWIGRRSDGSRHSPLATRHRFRGMCPVSGPVLSCPCTLRWQSPKFLPPEESKRPEF